ncbi:DUF4118 domain-containing protein [Streptomyces swartbergensis]|uniref:DUF4118 domain-containing protein n=1 Tax=Streptomyces swartbergensis TaxID=487165 RepID=UPI0037FEB73A
MLGPALLTGLLTSAAPDVGLANDMLLFLTLTVAAALLGGLFPALASAVVGSLLLNWYFTPPVHTLTIADPENIVAIVVFVGVAVSVASVVDLAARRTHLAARLLAEAEILSFLAGNVLRGETTLEALLERVRETFGMESVALLERTGETAPWSCAGSVGPRPAGNPEDADVDVPVGDHMALSLRGRVLPASDRRVLAAFAAQAAVVLDRQRLRREADRAKELAEGNRMRTALLAAVSHDLRTPLAGIKAGRLPVAFCLWCAPLPLRCFARSDRAMPSSRPTRSAAACARRWRTGGALRHADGAVRQPPVSSPHTPSLSRISATARSSGHRGHAPSGQVPLARGPDDDRVLRHRRHDTVR